MITKRFENIILDQMFRGVNWSVDKLYLGLCNNHEVWREMEQSSIVEVTGKGYARIEVPRDAVNWDKVKDGVDCQLVRSAVKEFVPKEVEEGSGKTDWTPFVRMFISTGSQPNTGELLAVSTALPLETKLTTTEEYPVSFEFYLK